MSFFVNTIYYNYILSNIQKKEKKYTFLFLKLDIMLRLPNSNKQYFCLYDNDNICKIKKKRLHQ